MVSTTAPPRPPPPPPPPTPSHAVVDASHSTSCARCATSLAVPPPPLCHLPPLPLAADVEFVLSHCDTDGDGSINRGELLPMLAEWTVPHRPHSP